MAATSILNKPLSMANITLTSLPAFLTSKPSLPHSLSIAPRPIRSLHLSFSSFSPFFCARKTLALTPFVAQTSDWAPDGSSDVVDEGDVALVHDDATWEGGEDQAVDSPSVAVAEGEVDDAFVDEEEAATADDAFVDEEEAEDTYIEPPEDAKLFVGNLPYELESETLAQLFEKAGVVEVAEVIYNRETDQSRGFGFVTMRTVEEAEKAVEMFHRYDVNGRQLTVNKASPRGSRPPVRSFEPSFRVYVGNLPWQVDGSRLEQVFSEHGKVVDARVVYDRETGRSRGFGFVTMESQNELDDAIAALDGQTLDGRAIRVNVAEERPRRGAF